MERTTLVNKWFYRPILIRGVEDYVQPCGCRRREFASSQWLAMFPARFFRPMDIFEMDIQNMGQRIEANTHHLLTAVDKASKFPCTFLLPTKEALEVTRTILNVVLTFGLPVSLCSDPGMEFTTEVATFLVGG